MEIKSNIAPPVRIVHLGLGAFFRAHGCAYLQDLGNWGVMGVSLRSPAVRDALRLRDYSYFAAALTNNGMDLRQIDIVRGVMVATEDPSAVIRAMADPAISIVSLTVTEKGYCHDPATGKLNLSLPTIQADIKNPLPKTAIGFIVRGLQARYTAGLPPFTVMSCDNLPDNGALTHRVTVMLAEQIDPNLAQWISTEGAFPSSMVDRIVPATTDADIARIKDISKQSDAAPVLHEPFSQWVITDNFIGDRPDFASVAVQIVKDITPFEHMKLRMLNGAHSALAYLGSLANFHTVAEAVANEHIAAYLTYLWQKEIIPTLTAPPDTNLATYAASLQKRFANTAIQHQLSQIAMDGSQKLPQRLLASIEDRLAKDKEIAALLLAVAGWIAYTANIVDNDDPMAATLRNCHSDDPRQTVANILALSSIFDPQLAAKIQNPLSKIYSDLCTKGPLQLIKDLVS